MSAPTPIIRVVAAVIEQDGRYLITQRRPSAVLPLLWEFPGGKVEDGEEDTAALQRELLHRLDVSIQVGQMISFTSHPYEHYTVELYLYECCITRGKPRSQHVHAFSWVLSSEFESYPFTPADERSMTQLLGMENL